MIMKESVKGKLEKGVEFNSVDVMSGGADNNN
jgi:hypothetical protein